MKGIQRLNFFILISAIIIPILLTKPALAVTTDVSSINNFLKSIIQAIAGLAGLVATGFFVIGGFIYITSTGNPAKLEKAKRTLLFSSLGLAITIAAFVLSNIITQLATKAFGN